jgi:hypothetical protein
MALVEHSITIHFAYRRRLASSIAVALVGEHNCPSEIPNEDLR